MLVMIQILTLLGVGKTTSANCATCTKKSSVTTPETEETGEGRDEF